MTSVQEAPTIKYPGRGQFQAASVTVLSVSPIGYRKSYNRTAVLENGMVRAAQITYELEPCPRDEFRTVKIYDGQQMIRNTNTATDEYEGDMGPMPITAMQDAQDFVAHCTGGTIMRQGGPGVLICAGDKPTQQEIDKARAIQTIYATFLIDDAHSKYSKGDYKEITEEARRQADWMGVNVPWRVKLEKADIKKCPACAEDILAPALTCRHCNTFLPDFYTMAQLNPENDVVVKHYLAMKKEGVKAQSPPNHPMPGTPIEPPIKK